MSAVLEKDIITVGCDPELMIQDKKSGQLKSAIKILKGRKHEPEKVDGGFVHSDNVNLEFNCAPAKTAAEFAKNIGKVIKESNRLVGKSNVLIVRASANFPKSELDDAEAKEFGCEPDYDAWKLKVNKPPKEAAASPFRTCGGHIHVGMTPKSKKLLSEDMGKIRTIKMMDLVLGTLSVILDSDPTSMERRALYGGAGAHRPKSYGVEYRSIGNFWVKSPELVELMHDLTVFSVQVCLDNADEALIKSVGEEKIRTTINSSDKTAAKKIFSETLTQILPSSVLKKIQALEGKQFDFYKEWNLS